MQPEAIARHVSLHVRIMSKSMSTASCRPKARAVGNLPAVVKAQIYQHVRRSLPPMIDGLALALLRKSITGRRARDDRQSAGTRPGLMVPLFCEVGECRVPLHHQHQFLDRPGFGCCRWCCLFPALAWTAAAVCRRARLATNWIALAMVFRPLNPLRIGPLKLHGLFCDGRTRSPTSSHS